VKAEVERSFAEARRAPFSTVFSPTPSGLKLLREEKSHRDDSDNPPLSVTFTRYYAERKLPAKTRLEWNGVLRRIQAVCGGDVRVRSVTQAHARMLKDSLLATPARRGGGTLSPATVQKNLSGLRAVLGWAKRNGYVSSNPAEDMIVVTKPAGNEGRLPYAPEDLKVIFNADRGRGANHWLPWLALYTGARLEELGQLRVTDVRHAEGVHFLAIEPGDGTLPDGTPAKRVKTKASKRRVPIHPRLIELGFLDYVKAQRTERIFPELTATSYGSLTAAWSKWWGHRDAGHSRGGTIPQAARRVPGFRAANGPRVQLLRARRAARA